MVIRNCTTNVSFGPRTYHAPGSNGETYTVTHFHDDTWTCQCAWFEKRIRIPVPVKYGCKHQRNAANGDYGKPRVRVTVRASKRQRVISEEMRDFLTSMDI